MSALSSNPAAGDTVRDAIGAELAGFARIVLASAAVGVLTVGVVSRLMMRLLAGLNADATGVTSDDGFEMGRFTLAGSLNLVVLGVLIGVLSGVLFVVLDPVRLGPRWFRTVSLAIGAGTVAGAALVHTSGIDFQILDPVQLAIALFVVLPIVHILLVDLVATRVRRPGVLPGRGWTIGGLVLSLVAAPLTAAVLAVRGLAIAAAGQGTAGRIVSSGVWVWLARAALTVWFGFALTELVEDVRSLT
jgi:hypothetical protein